jgi:hypothetical protein
MEAALETAHTDTENVSRLLVRDTFYVPQHDGRSVLRRQIDYPLVDSA